MKSFEHELIDILTLKNPSQSLADAYALKTGSALTVLDMNYDTILISNPTGTENEAKITIEHYISRNFLRRLQDKSVEYGIVSLYQSTGDQTLLWQKILINGNAFYFFSPVSSYTQENEHFFYCICLSVKLALTIRDQNSFHLRKMFLSELFGGEINNEALALARARGHNLPAITPTSIIVGKSLYKPFALQSSDELGGLFTDSCVIEYDGCFVILCYSPALSQRDSGALSKAELYCKDQQMQLCICPITGSFLSIPAWFRAAQELLDFCRLRRIYDTVIYYEEHYIYYVLHRLPGEELEHLCNPEVWQLFELDLNTGSDYVPILFAYLLCFGQKADAAKLLGLSYNTVKTRLSNMRNIVRGNFEDFSPSLYVSIKIIMCQNKSIWEKCTAIERRLCGIRGGMVG